MDFTIIIGFLQFVLFLSLFITFLYIEEIDKIDSNLNIKTTKEKNTDYFKDKYKTVLNELVNSNIKNKYNKVLDEIISSNFSIQNYELSALYNCFNKKVKFQICFCIECGNYICFRTEPNNKILCKKYKVVDCIDHEILGTFSGHINNNDIEEFINTIDNVIESKTELEREYYKTKINSFILD